MPIRHLPPGLGRLFRFITWIENALLITLLALMVGLAATQILLRNFLESSIFSADQMLRLLVLWVAFLGAVAASREGKHIHIDAIVRWIPGRLRFAVMALTDLFTFSVCLVLVWESLRFVQDARISAELAFGRLPVWVSALILPLGFLLIALRYGLRCLHHAHQVRNREAAE